METGDKVFLRKNGRGSYLMDVTFASGKKTEITVDSGAEESVCPWNWGEQFGIYNASAWMSFKDAQGGYIEHYGQREVWVTGF